MPYDVILYILKLQDGCYYVGQSSSVQRRIEKHNAAKGAAWTQIHPPVSLVECKRISALDKKAAETKESLLTLEMMKKYGWRNVRGGWFCHVDEKLTAEALRAHGVFELLEPEQRVIIGNSVQVLDKKIVNECTLKKVTISSVGSCDTETRFGSYEVLLEYNGRRKYLKRNLHDTTVNRCIIQGLIDGALLLKEPCNVNLVTSTSIGLSSFPKLKGPNADMLKELVAIIENRGCKFTFEIVAGQGDILRRHVHCGQEC